MQLCALLTALVGVLMLLGRNALGRTEQVALNWWVTGCISFAIGLLLLTSRNHLPDALCVIGGHAVMVGGLAGFLIAVRRYAQRTDLLLQVPLSALAAGIAAASYWYLGQTPLLSGLVASVHIVILLQSVSLMIYGYRNHSIILKLLLGVYGVAGLSILIRALSGQYPAGGYEDLLRFPDNGALDIVAVIGTFPLLATIMFLMVCAERTNRQLYNSTRTDFLTGILNRRALYEQGHRFFMRCKEKSFPFSLLILDIDFFKTINDRYGHAAGDDVLVEFTARISKALRVTDVLGRIGGEEFVALLPNANYDDAEKVAERLRVIIASSNFEYAVHAINVTTSIGAATLHSNDKDFSVLLARADAALINAKNNGRNQVISAEFITTTP